MENKVEKNETMTDTEELEKAADALLEKAEEKPAPKKRTRKKAKTEEPAPAETAPKAGTVSYNRGKEQRAASAKIRARIKALEKRMEQIDEEIATEILMTPYEGMTYTNLNKMDKYDHVVDYCIREFTDLFDPE